MPRGPKSTPLRACRAVRRRLTRLVAKRQAPFALVQRARIVLLACAGRGTSEIAAEVGWSPRTVRKWKARFRDKPSVEGLDDLPRSGRKAEIPLWVRCELVSLACHRPEKMKTPFRNIWTREALAVALERRTGFRLSVSEIGRILHNKELRPHRVRQWLKSTDPNFRKRARRVCDIYLNPPADTVVLCVDEKPMQALERVSQTHLNVKDASVRYEYEYKRNGVQALLAAFDIRTGDVVAEVVPNRTGAALVGFMDKVADAYPNQKVMVIWDNLNIHTDGAVSRWTSFNRRHDGRFTFVYTPKHASWMNQIEIWFSILHRRVLKYASFESLEHQRDEVCGFVRYWNLFEKHPFRWTWRVPRRRRNVTRRAA